jgi:hypothetical protein
MMMATGWLGAVRGAPQKTNPSTTPNNNKKPPPTNQQTNKPHKNTKKVLPDLGLICEIMLMSEGFQAAKLLARKFVILYRLVRVRVLRLFLLLYCLCACAAGASTALCAPRPPCRRVVPKSTPNADKKPHTQKTTKATTTTKQQKKCEDLLSKSRHYDWKLRAIKTTLYVSGRMKRGAPELSEDKVLLRALRDFNLGKLTSDDTAIFLGLLNDLFPRTLELVPRAVEPDFESKVRVFVCLQA